MTQVQFCSAGARLSDACSFARLLCDGEDSASRLPKSRRDKGTSTVCTFHEFPKTPTAMLRCLSSTFCSRPLLVLWLCSHKEARTTPASNMRHDTLRMVGRVPRIGTIPRLRGVLTTATAALLITCGTNPSYKLCPLPAADKFFLPPEQARDTQVIPT